MSASPESRLDLLKLTAGQPRILLLLDFDGTLSDIAPRPEDAVLRAGNARLLRGLADAPGCGVGVISGRSLADVRQRVGVPGLVYAGNHGLEISGPSLEYRHPGADAAAPAVARAAQLLASGLSSAPGALVENKSLTLTVHYRQTPPEYRGVVRSVFREVAQPLLDGGTGRVTEAKEALELRPAVDWDKGRALALIRSRLFPAAFPIYIGDDATDEDAFRAAQAAGGTGVFVGPSTARTSADHRVHSPREVTDALSRLYCAIIGAGSPGATGPVSS